MKNEKPSAISPPSVPPRHIGTGPKGGKKEISPLGRIRGANLEKGAGGFRDSPPRPLRKNLRALSVKIPIRT